MAERDRFTAFEGGTANLNQSVFNSHLLDGIKKRFSKKTSDSYEGQPEPYELQDLFNFHFNHYGSCFETLKHHKDKEDNPVLS